MTHDTNTSAPTDPDSEVYVCHVCPKATTWGTGYGTHEPDADTWERIRAAHDAGAFPSCYAEGGNLLCADCVPAYLRWAASVSFVDTYGDVVRRVFVFGPDVEDVFVTAPDVEALRLAIVARYGTDDAIVLPPVDEDADGAA